MFMGSAGLIQGEKGAYYDASVPSRFIKGTGEVDIDNMIFSHHEYGKNYRTSKDSIIWGTRHAHSSSPVEQTNVWLQDKKRKSVGTVDVEVSLVADSIRAHNEADFANIDFGVINLVTDKPSLSADDEVDLNNVSGNEKRKGQILFQVMKTILLILIKIFVKTFLNIFLALKREILRYIMEWEKLMHQISTNFLITFIIQTLIPRFQKLFLFPWQPLDLIVIITILMSGGTNMVKLIIEAKRFPWKILVMWRNIYEKMVFLLIQK
jgi:hypothetical protein